MERGRQLREGSLPSKAPALQLLEQGHVLAAEGLVFSQYMERGMQLEQDLTEAKQSFEAAVAAAPEVAALEIAAAPKPAVLMQLTPNDCILGASHNTTSAAPKMLPPSPVAATGNAKDIDLETTMPTETQPPTTVAIRSDTSDLAAPAPI